jgi:uncharacterized protein with von Willebrand factor type A (vWA) domain
MSRDEARESIEKDSKELADRLAGKIPVTDEDRKKLREDIDARRKASGSDKDKKSGKSGAQGDKGEKNDEDQDGRGTANDEAKSEPRKNPGGRGGVPEQDTPLDRDRIMPVDISIAGKLRGLKDLQEKLRNSLTKYDIYYSRVVTLAERLFGLLDNELHKDERFQYKGYYENGPKVDLRKAMVMEKTQDTKIWLKRVRPTKRSFKFILVLDQSGSMSSGMDVALSTIVMLQEVLSRLDIDFAIVGFSSGVEIHKNFEDKFQQQNKDELISELKSAMERGGSTAEGDGMAVALKLIEKEMSDERFIIVITDGEGNCGSNDVKIVLKEAQKKFVEVIGIGIGME